MRMRRLAPLALVPLLLLPPTLAAQGKGPQVYLDTGPDVGADAPDFTLPWASADTTGTDADAYGLWRDRGNVVVLAFYPRDFTRTDSLQLSAFRDRYNEVFGSGVVVLGISIDSPDSHRRFAATLGLPFRLLSDPDQAVAAKYGSKDTGGIDRRTVYVIGPNGLVRWRELRFDPNNSKSYEALRRAVRAARHG
jgi:thioredoxin-dependent peroxiredoxin